MRHLVSSALGIGLSCVFFATAEAQSPDASAPAPNPSDNMTVAPRDGSTQRDLKLMVPDGFGGLTDLPDATKFDSDPSTGSVLITPADPQILPPNENDTTEPAR
jgi:hypothetical protein